MKYKISDEEFRVMLSLWMCADPSPLEKKQDVMLTKMLSRMAKKRGYPDLIEAYHRHMMPEMTGEMK